MFFIAAALVLTTAGVFAGKAKFTNTIYAYYEANGAYTNLTTSVPSTAIMSETTNGSQVQLIDGIKVYDLYEFDGTTYHALYPATGL